ncbi:hypothetical protein [Atopobacter phocae]|uniref:hypothetical protein n=1 Tax=Atopobacter phocae TaxID=136492 RepID=UPI0004715C0B|nr:hypothetical protein [Atopobacter phocae]
MTIKHEEWTDRQFRYQYILGQRHSQKQKRRFIKSLISDILPHIQEDDLKIIVEKYKGIETGTNVYIGNLKTAQKVICTYYDTPSFKIGKYYPFNSNLERKKVIEWNIIISSLVICLGLMMTYFLFNVCHFKFSLGNVSSWLVILIYLLYFMVLKKSSLGTYNPYTLIRNTSSLLTMLEMINKHSIEKIAFVFLDNGIYGKRKFSEIQKQMKTGCDLYYLDSIGSNGPLHIMKVNNLFKNVTADRLKGNIYYAFSSSNKKADSLDEYYLTFKALKSTRINEENIKKFMKEIWGDN